MIKRDETRASERERDSEREREVSWAKLVAIIYKRTSNVNKENEDEGGEKKTSKEANGINSWVIKLTRKILERMVRRWSGAASVN